MKWLVIGHFGGHNTGDEAMLSGLICGALRATQHEYVIATKTGRLDISLQNPRVHAIRSRTSIILRNIQNSSGVILGGGTHFHDDYLWLRLFRHYGYMIRLLIIFAYAKLMRKRVYWLGVGMGPFRFPLTILLTRLGIQLCDQITVRDVNSLTAIARISTLTYVRYGFDLAALMMLDSHKDARLSSNASGKRVIGLSVLSMKDIVSSEFDQELLETVCSALVTVLSDIPESILRIFVIRGGNRESDTDISNRYYDRLVNWLPHQIEIVDYIDDPKRTLSLIGGCEGFIAMRFHASLLAYLSRSRLLLLSYHQKVQDLALEIGLHPDACIQIREQNDSNLIATRITAMLCGDKRFEAKLEVQEALMLSIRSLDLL